MEDLEEDRCTPANEADNGEYGGVFDTFSVDAQIRLESGQWVAVKLAVPVGFWPVSSGGTSTASPAWGAPLLYICAALMNPWRGAQHRCYSMSRVQRLVGRGFMRLNKHEPNAWRKLPRIVPAKRAQKKRNRREEAERRKMRNAAQSAEDKAFWRAMTRGDEARTAYTTRFLPLEMIPAFVWASLAGQRFKAGGVRLSQDRAGLAASLLDSGAFSEQHVDRSDVARELRYLPSATRYALKEALPHCIRAARERLEGVCG
jgi:hypothetical protein